MGLSGSVPLLLANRVSYSDQAILSFCSWPFSLKLLMIRCVSSPFATSFKEEMFSLGKEESSGMPLDTTSKVMGLTSIIELDKDQYLREKRIKNPKNKIEHWR